MKQLKQLKLLILTIITGLLLYGCQDDFEHTHDHTTQKQNIILKEYSLDQANKIPQFRIANQKALNELKKSRKSNKTSSRETGDYIAIDAATVKEISFDDFTSYTMLVKKETDTQDYFENLVVHVKQDTITEVFLMKYTPTQPPVYDEATKSYTLIGNIGMSALITTFFGEGGVDYEEGGGGATGWTTCAWVLMCNGRNGGGIGPEHRATPYCQHKYLKQMCSLNIQISSGCGISTDNGDTPTGNGPGGSGTGNGSNNITTSNPITTPVIPKTPEELKADIFKTQFFDVLSLDKQQLLATNNSVLKSIKEYITLNIDITLDGQNIDSEAVQIAYELMEYFKEELSYSENSTDPELEIALDMTLDFASSNSLSTSTSNLAILGPSFGTTDHIVVLNAIILQEMSIIMSSYPNGHVFSKMEILKIYLESCKESLLLMSDVLGMAPAVGAFFDVTSGLIYTCSGDYLNGAISFTAAVPFAGDWTTVARITKRIYNLITGKKVILKAYKLIDGTIVFSNRGQLRKVLGIVNNAIHAHHVIPYGLSSERLVQLAARFSSPTKKAFHINDIANGIAMPKDFHLNGHLAYSNKIKARMEVLYGYANGNIELAYDLLTDYMDDVRDIIAANPNLTLGQIATLIP
ncbi:hypothetical protein [Flavobacterium sp.]|uniref:hypothetical protein n=1 Tax=Flavobacterium sp. TaxID=239 RepID=UPI00286D74B4|nr:hypothetical protein [Flavobacterium sp.]